MGPHGGNIGSGFELFVHVFPRRFLFHVFSAKAGLYSYPPTQVISEEEGIGRK
jgi:hypothetical protein